MRAYVDRPITDVAGADRAAAVAATHWGLPAPTVIRYGMNAVYTAGEEILRVSTPNASAAALIALVHTLRARNIPAATPARETGFAVDDFVVTAWRAVRPTGRPVDWATVGAAVRTLHDTPPSALPIEFPLSAPNALPWWDFDRQLAASTPIDADARVGLLGSIERHAEWLDPETWEQWRTPRVVCHGDVHPGNVVATAHGPVIVDFDLLASAPAAWDHGPLMSWEARWGGPVGMYDDFAAGYGANLRDDAAAVAFAELRLVAATLLRGVAARHDPAARPEFERRLRYWRGESDAPMWQAV
ncbi:MAG: phosphotransferase [Actinomycetota bacterium]